jgi:hypothetical protein
MSAGRSPDTNFATRPDLHRTLAAFFLIFIALAAGALAGPASADDPAHLQALVRAYPDALSGIDGSDLVWRDGTRMAVTDGRPGKSLQAMLRTGSILDQFSMLYPSGSAIAAPAPGDDPGRVRNRAFFDKMYGDCHRGEVAPHLVPVVWLPNTWGRTVSVTSVNGVDRRLAEVSREIDALPPALKAYAYPLGGTYNCRTVADTGQPSMHGWGAAIDINPARADSWLWHRGDPADAYTNRIPEEIVAIFERHGFIWGGRWSHFDTMHFEYRPELLNYDPRTRE